MEETYLGRFKACDKSPEGRKVEETLDNCTEPTRLPNILESNRPLKLNSKLELYLAYALCETADDILLWTLNRLLTGHLCHIH